MNPDRIEFRPDEDQETIFDIGICKYGKIIAAANILEYEGRWLVGKVDDTLEVDRWNMMPRTHETILPENSDKFMLFLLKNLMEAFVPYMKLHYEVSGERALDPKFWEYSLMAADIKLHEIIENCRITQSMDFVL